MNRHENYETELKTSNYQSIVTSLKNSELKTSSSSRNNLKSTIILVASLRDTVKRVTETKFYTNNKE